MKEEARQAGVSITVSDPQVKKEYGGAKQYYLYTIKGHDSKGSIDIHRRYSDFDAIRNLLVKRWPGCYIPSLPSKVKLAHSDQQFLETRSKYLRKFLLEVSTRSFLWDSDEMQIFLRNSMMDFDKVISAFWKVEPMELLYRYGLHFKGDEEKEGAEEKIQKFGNYLANLFVKVQELRNRSEEINNAQARYQRKYSKFLLNVLSSYEEKFLNYYNQDNKSFIPIFSSAESIEKKAELQQSMKEVPLKILFQELKREKREIFAIQEALKGYEEYSKEKTRIQGKIKEHEIKIAELKNGKKSFFSKIRNVSTDDDIKSHEKSLQKYGTELQQINEICAHIRRILHSSEIESFKKERTESYYKMVRQIAQEELKIIEKEREFWLAVCSNNNFEFDIEEKVQSKPKRKKREKVEKRESEQIKEVKVQSREQEKIEEKPVIVEKVQPQTKQESKAKTQQNSASPRKASPQKEEQKEESPVPAQTVPPQPSSSPIEKDKEQDKQFSQFQQINDDE